MCSAPGTFRPPTPSSQEQLLPSPITTLWKGRPLPLPGCSHEKRRLVFPEPLAKLHTLLFFFGFLMSPTARAWCPWTGAGSETCPLPLQPFPQCYMGGTPQRSLSTSCSETLGWFCGSCWNPASTHSSVSPRPSLSFHFLWTDFEMDFSPISLLKTHYIFPLLHVSINSLLFCLVESEI